MIVALPSLRELTSKVETLSHSLARSGFRLFQTLYGSGRYDRYGLAHDGNFSPGAQSAPKNVKERIVIARSSLLVAWITAKQRYPRIRMDY